MARKSADGAVVVFKATLGLDQKSYDVLHEIAPENFSLALRKLVAEYLELKSSPPTMQSSAKRVGLTVQKPRKETNAAWVPVLPTFNPKADSERRALIKRIEALESEYQKDGDPKNMSSKARDSREADRLRKAHDL